jgi:3D (Asp-Asp-Asp) domain-containing protein
VPKCPAISTPKYRKFPPARPVKRRHSRTGGLRPLVVAAALPLALLGSATLPTTAKAEASSASPTAPTAPGAPPAPLSFAAALDTSGGDATASSYGVVDFRIGYPNLYSRLNAHRPSARRPSTSAASGDRLSGPAGAGQAPGTVQASAAVQAPAVTATAAAASGAAGRPLGTFVVTCYDLSGRTATGTYTNEATVAVDPSVIPLGSSIYISGVGARLAEDTGGAIVGDRLDIWEPTYADCAAWGVEDREVWLQG